MIPKYTLGYLIGPCVLNINYKKNHENLGDLIMKCIVDEFIYLSTIKCLKCKRIVLLLRDCP